MSPSDACTEGNAAIMAHIRKKRDTRAEKVDPVHNDPRFWVSVAAVVVSAARFLGDWFR
jgi:hypothetical protein